MVQCRRIIIERAQEPRATNTLRAPVPENARFQESRIFSMVAILGRMEEEESADGQQKRAIRKNETIRGSKQFKQMKSEKETEREREREHDAMVGRQKGERSKGSGRRMQEREPRRAPPPLFNYISPS